MIHGNIKVRSSETPSASQTISTEKVRVEFLRCAPRTTVEWAVTGPEISIVWMSNGNGEAQIRVADGDIDHAKPGKAPLWFFPEGVEAEGRLKGDAAFDCIAVFIDPAFLAPSAKQALTVPLTGFRNDALLRAFNALAGELTRPDDVLPLFIEGWAMQALAYVARTASEPRPNRVTYSSGLAPWQLRRAKEMLRAGLADNMSPSCVAEACRLSVSHFSRAFKASTGVPPHQWLMAERVETAQRLLVHSHAPLVDVAGMCGFADQSHFARVFGRAVGKSPAAWRREHRSESHVNWSPSDMHASMRA